MKKLLLPVFLVLSAMLTSCGNAPSDGAGTDDSSKALAKTTTARTLNFPIRNCATGNCALPADCDGTNPCADADCYEAILNCHKLEPDQFNKLVTAYHSPAFDPKVLDFGNIDNVLQGAGGACNGWALKVADYSTNPDNQSIETELVSEMGDSTVVSIYTVAMFKAIKSLNPSEIHFWKGKHANGCDDIVFKVYRQDTEVFCGDLAGVYP